MNALEKFQKKVEWVLLRNKIREEFYELKLHYKNREYRIIKGQKFKDEDPYGEENWDS